MGIEIKNEYKYEFNKENWIMRLEIIWKVKGKLIMKIMVYETIISDCFKIWLLGFWEKEKRECNMILYFCLCFSYEYFIYKKIVKIELYILV